MATERIALADLIEHVTKELLKASKAADKNDRKVMQFAECEIEFAVEAEKEVGGGIKVWVLDLKAGGKKTESNTVKVKFSGISNAVLQYMQQHDQGDGPDLEKQ